MTRTGRVRGLPAPGPGTRSVFISCGKTVQSLTFPAVTTRARGSPRPSTARWALPVGPPRDRPRAWRFVPECSPSCGHRLRAGEPARSWSRRSRTSRGGRVRRGGPGRAPAAGRTCRRPPTCGSAHRRSSRCRSAPAGPATEHPSRASTRSRSTSRAGGTMGQPTLRRQQGRLARRC
jgi:hypothetical protein